METLKPRLSLDQRLEAFKAADAFTIEAFRTARKLGQGDGAGLAREIRRTAARSGGALVAASARTPGGEAERRCLEAAREGLVEGRYYLYLARRVGLLDLRRYRGLATRQDAALREVDALLRISENGGARPP